MIWCVACGDVTNFNVFFSIAVLSNERFENILNRGYHVKPEFGVFNVGGLKITYSGSRSYPEYVKIEGKLTQKIHLQVSVAYSFLDEWRI